MRPYIYGLLILVNPIMRNSLRSKIRSLTSDQRVMIFGDEFNKIYTLLNSKQSSFNKLRGQYFMATTFHKNKKKLL